MSSENLCETIAVQIASHPEWRVRPGAVSDVIRRLVGQQVALTSTGEAVAPGGRNLGEFIDQHLRPEAPHLFAPNEPASTLKPKPQWRGMTATQKLERINGDTEPKL